MALSNMLKEPRREITETVIGVALVSGFLFADYYFASWFVNADLSAEQRSIETVLFMIMGFAVTVLFVTALICAHALGDAVCNWLAGVGADPRPKQRYR